MNSLKKKVEEKGATLASSSTETEIVLSKNEARDIWTIKLTEDDIGVPSLDGKELENAISQAVNRFGFETKAFTAAIQTEHKTLQQSMMRDVFMPAIQQMAQGHPDLRNEQTVRLAKSICALPEVQEGLPLI